MSDIAKLIDETIESVMTEAEVVTEDKLEVMKGWYGNKLYDKLHPDEDKPDLKFETIKKLAKKNRELEGMGVKEHLAKAGTKAVKATKDVAEDVKDKAIGAAKKGAEVAKEAAEDVKGKVVGAVKSAKDMDVKSHLVAAGKKALKGADEVVREHPYLSAAAAAALAAGAGGLAAVKRMRKAGKK